MSLLHLLFGAAFGNGEEGLEQPRDEEYDVFGFYLNYSSTNFILIYTASWSRT